MKVTKSMMALAATLTGATGAMAAGESVEVAKFDKRSPVRSIRAKIKVRKPKDSRSTTRRLRRFPRRSSGDVVIN